MYLHHIQPQHSLILLLIAIPVSISVEQFIDSQLSEFKTDDKIRACLAIFNRKYTNVFYSLVLHLSSQSIADKLFNAFNGRFFNDVDSNGAIMHSVFLSEPVIFKKQSSMCELKLIQRFTKQHKGAHFDRLPSCPSCLDGLDNSLTGLQTMLIVQDEQDAWPNLSCASCCLP